MTSGFIERIVKASEVRYGDRLVNEPGRPLVITAKRSLDRQWVTFILDAVGSRKVTLGANVPVKVLRRAREENVDGEDYSDLPTLLGERDDGPAVHYVRRPRR